MPYPRFPLVTLCLALASSASAQHTWVVDATGHGHFTSLQAAVDVASDGDMLVLRSSSIPPSGFVDVHGKGLVIAGPYRDANGLGGSRLRIRDVPAGRTVLLRNLSFHGSEYDAFGIEISDCDGVVHVEGCRLRANVAVHVVRCREVTLSDCALRAYTWPVLSYAPPTGGALRIEDSLVVVDGGSIMGENGNPGTSGLSCTAGEDGTPGIVCLGASTLWCTDLEARGGAGGAGGASFSYFCQDGRDAVAAWVASGARLLHRATIFQHSLVGPNAALSPPARALRVTENAPSRGVARMRFEGLPGETVLVLVARELTSHYIGDESGLYQSASSVQGGRRYVGALDSLGVLELDVLVPSLTDDSIEPWYLQAVFIDTLTGLARFAPRRALLVVGELAPVAAAGTTVRVDAGAAPGGLGRTWADAVAELADGVGRAWPLPGRDVEVWLREGVHLPTYAASHPTEPLSVPGGVRLLGGFAGFELQESERDPRLHRTVLSGDVLGDDGPGFANRADNKRRLLVTGPSDSLATVLDGLVFSGCEGGYSVLTTSPFIIRDCEVRDNRTFGTLPLLRVGGEAIARVERCVFEANRGQVLQASGNSLRGPLSIEGCVFRGNVTDTGLVQLQRGGALTFAHCTVAQNRVGIGRSALEIDVHHGNFSPGRPEVWHCIVTGNVDAGIHGFAAQVNLDGLMPDAVLRRTLVEDYPSATSAEGSFGADPLFIDPLGPDGAPGTGDEDLRLRAGSPAVDAGYEWLVPPSLMLDLDGRPRRADDPFTPDTGLGAPPFADLGAYER